MSRKSKNWNRGNRTHKINSPQARVFTRGGIRL